MRGGRDCNGGGAYEPALEHAEFDVVFVVTQRQTRLVAVGVIVIAAIAGLVARNQMKVHRGRQARAALMQQRHPVGPLPAAAVQQQREALFAMLQPVALANCELERFGESNDGGVPDVRQPAR